MRTLADAAELSILSKLSGWISTGQLTPVQAWSIFKSPKLVNKFDKPNSFSINLLQSEVDSLGTLQKKVKENLDKKCVNRCAYCKRVRGAHGFSWHIEHIKAKSKHPNQTFLLRNLAMSCVDCNMTKNSAVDRSNPYVFDIIDPNAPSFDYSKHLTFFQFATESIHVLKFQPISTAGTNTYSKLKFSVLERIHVLESLNSHLLHLNDRLNDTISSLGGTVADTEMASFLHELKLKIFSK